ncbi:phosphoserine aminotransferase apoenzyme [Spirosomataceae bacterium TFI 002]|nr:phosphoserine aminotransferase apoenzyme [Spirosomataceae bacterium TFI 002]
MLNFYPGPSKIYPQVKQWTAEAFESGILEQNHRSDSFMNLLKNTIENFKTAQAIPANYSVYFTSSATECWEIVNQSLLHGKVQFAYNGAFGKKWFKYAVTNHTPFLEEIRGSRFEINETLVKVDIDESNDCLCFIHNETSNGSSVKTNHLDGISPDTYRFIDATSSLGGLLLPWDQGDVWLCSTQKCLGLPSGMGIMVVSDRILSKATELGEKNHYNSFLTIATNFEKYQTHYTPNILLIYLLNEVAKNFEDISKIDKRVKSNSKHLYDFIDQHNLLNPLISAEECRSETVLSIAASENIIRRIHEKAQKNEIILGRGYGEWKENSFRIANFPAHNPDDFHQLKAFLGTI